MYWYNLGSIPSQGWELFQSSIMSLLSCDSQELKRFSVFFPVFHNYFYVLCNINAFCISLFINSRVN